ncbi:hypothetical protein [Dyella sp.]|uniref:hypothetical protein n=1 Tax=Dyella sp. TaxID=1869338 RepID=UPI002D770AF2|nr:hypothetical protein [Dyella sp.]HET7331062.1 hypothetical protein [Dyella sp.]
MDMTDATEWEGVLLGRKVRRSMGDAQMVRPSSAVYCDNSHGCVRVMSASVQGLKQRVRRS